jgi:hypothetical protein
MYKAAHQLSIAAQGDLLPLWDTSAIDMISILRHYLGIHQVIGRWVWVWGFVGVG